MPDYADFFTLMPPPILMMPLRCCHEAVTLIAAACLRDDTLTIIAFAAPLRADDMIQDYFHYC